MDSIRDKILLSTKTKGISQPFRYGSSRPGVTWHTPFTSSYVNIVMLTQNHQNLRVRIKPKGSTAEGSEIFHAYDQNNGDGWATATFVVPIGYTYQIVTNRGEMYVYEFPLII